MHARLTGVYPQNFEWPGMLCVGSPCPLYHSLIRKSFDKSYANVIMILEGHGASYIHNHLANSAGMG